MSPRFPTRYPQAGDPASRSQEPARAFDPAAADDEVELGLTVAGDAGSGDDLPIEEQAWHATVETLRGRMSPHSLKTFVLSARLLATRPGFVVLGYPSSFLLDMVAQSYRAVFEAELAAVADVKVQVELRLDERPSEAEVPLAPNVTGRIDTGHTDTGITDSPELPPRPAARIELPGRGEPPVARRLSNGLDQRYTFDTFVVGASNQFAYAACKAVADGPGRTYNPLFLWGGVGLGKTHLMHAVGHKAVADRPGLTVLYVTAEQFTNDLINGIQTRRMNEFRRKYRECDILLIDDIQFIAHRQATEEEFFHTFNALHSRGKQIIVTSDSVPAEIDQLEERLRSRFQWGLIADIQPPEIETRIAILKAKAAQMHVDLGDDVAQFLATHIRHNVRELEGSLVRIAAYARLMRSSISVETCKDVLRSVLANRGEKLDCEQVIKAVSDRFKVPVAEIKGRVRKQHIARARQAAMYLCRRLTDASFPHIGEKFGGKDHSTVMHACERVPELMAEDEDFRRHVETLERELGRVNG